MKIYRPLKTDWKTQDFGENKACVAVDDANRVIIPTIVRTTLTGICDLGFMLMYKAMGMLGHNGWDYGAWNGQAIYFPVDADCEWWGRNEVDADGGYGLDVFSDRPIDIGELPEECGSMARSEFLKYKGKVYVKFRFWHLSQSLTPDAIRKPEADEEGFFGKVANVKFGQKIALAGNTGASSGSHLHWSMKIVQKNSMTVDADNGYFGAVDITKYYENKFVLNVLQVKEKTLSLIEMLKEFISALQNKDWKTALGLTSEIKTKVGEITNLNK